MKNSTNTPFFRVRSLRTGAQFATALHHMFRGNTPNPEDLSTCAALCHQVVASRGRQPNRRESWGFQVLIRVRAPRDRSPEDNKAVQAAIVRFLQGDDFPTANLALLSHANADGVTA